MTKTASRTSIARSRLGLSQNHLHTSPIRLNSTGTSTLVEDIKAVNQGTKYSTDYKQYAVDKNGKILSWFHDIPMGLDVNTKEVNMIVEIPRWTNAKFEIATSLEGNPIVQDQKKGKVRFVKNLFPHHGYIHNYGAIPQTWEDPYHNHDGLDLYGDNDPLDVCDIGSTVSKTGDIVRVKVLGSIALIDDGELDWKVIVINTQDPLSKELFDIHDLYYKCPGLLETTRHWFKDYKLPDGKPQNKFAFNGVYKNQAETLEIILGCNQSWKKLISNQVKGDKLPCTKNSSLTETSAYTTFDSSLLSNPSKPDAAIPKEIEKSYFLTND